MILSCVLVLLFAGATMPFEMNNGVIGRADVQCGIDSISVSVHTEKPFKGRLYVDGESDKQHCVQQSFELDRQQFEVPIGACNMRRQRTFFVTGTDRAFSIRCFFLESIKSLDATVDVGTLAPESVDEEFSLPVCTYHLKEGVEGPPLRFAQVGQKVSHVWRCDQGASYIYGILIHSCFADDGHGNKFELVDDRGCSTDPYLLPQIEYDGSSISAVTHAQVFKYADKVQLYFTCTVQLCYKHDGGCDGITPPRCNGASPRDHLPIEPDFPHPPPPPPLPPHRHPKFEHLEEKRNHDFRGRLEGAPVIFGPPHSAQMGTKNTEIDPTTALRPDEFKVEASSKQPEERLGHSVPPFRGPNHEQAYFVERTESPIPELDAGESYRDSPLNETDVDETPIISMSVATLTTPELVTFKPNSQRQLPTARQRSLGNWGASLASSTSPTTTESLGRTSTMQKARRGVAGESMETDVSVDVIVLPVEEKEHGKDVPKALSFSRSSDVCISKPVTLVSAVGLVLILILCCTATFLWSRKHITHHLQAKRRIDNF